MKKLLICLLCIFLTGCTRNFVPYLNWSNDIVGGTDENFSNAIEVGVHVPTENMNETFLSAIREIPIPASSHLKDTSGRVGIRQDMYTPKDLRNPGIIEDNNPYGGTITVMVERVKASEIERISTELEVGMSGDVSFADETQKFIHNDLGFGVDPVGWGNQLAREPIFNVNHRKQYITGELDAWKLTFLHGMTGEVKFGNKETSATISPNIKFGYNPSKLNNFREGWSVYMFSDPYVKGTYHNIFYDGTVFRSSPHTVNSEAFSAGIHNGVAFGYDNYEIRFEYRTRTKDYEEQDGVFHNYGIISFGVTW